MRVRQTRLVEVESTTQIRGELFTLANNRPCSQVWFSSLEDVAAVPGLAFGGGA